MSSEGRISVYISSKRRKIYNEVLEACALKNQTMIDFLLDLYASSKGRLAGSFNNTDGFVTNLHVHELPVQNERGEFIKITFLGETIFSTSEESVLDFRIYRGRTKFLLALKEGNIYKTETFTHIIDLVRYVGNVIRQSIYSRDNKEEIKEYEIIYKALCTHFNTCYVRDGVVEIDL